MADAIQISDLEKRIFDTLKAVLLHFHLNTQLRVAGGWVRDKLLGKECYDIDIALEDMLGRDFCEKVNQYLKSINEEVRSVGVIQSNPDQSKHLETARMRMFGVWVDFVNLRAETYAENSRIPTMEFGTPEEDAYRRDLTINSLFYNINTSSVEDFTGKGLSDLKNGIIATPLPPKTTFLDDPLRVLRAIRFAARFDYKIEEDLKQAAADNDVKVALANKVSPERVGSEIDLMIMGPHPVRAIEELVNVDIFWIVFRLPQELKTCVPDETKRACLNTLDATSKVLDVFGSSKVTADQRRIGFYAALMLPLRSFTHQDRKKKLIPLANFIMRDSLKLKTNDADLVVSLHKAAEDFQTITGILLDKEQCDPKDFNEAEEWELSSQSRQAISAGLLMYKIKELWRVALLLSSVLDPSMTTELQVGQQAKERADQCFAVEAVVLKLGLENVWNLKPLLDGKAIMSELGLQQGGPKIKEWQNRIRKWQLCHLTCTTDACLEWLRGECTKRQRSS